MTDRIVSYDGRLKKIQLGTTTINLPNKVNLERGGHLQKWWSRDTQARTKFPKFPTESGLYAGRLISYYKQRFPAEVNAIVYSWPDAARRSFSTPLTSSTTTKFTSRPLLCLPSP